MPPIASTGRTKFGGADLRILAALEQPRTVNEISDALIHETREAWARDEMDAEWEDVKDYLPARLLAWGWGKDNDLPYLSSWHVYPRLRKLERYGLVERLQIEGRRPMLWRRTDG